MHLIPLSTKLPDQQVKALKSLSTKTRIPQSELIREAINMVLLRYREDIVTPEVRKAIDYLLHKDAKLLDRLAGE